MAFDGIVTKAIAEELKTLIGYKIDKVYQPTKNTILLGLYGNYNKLALNICIDSSFYRMHLTTHQKPNPAVAPNFCMLLRKHLIGSKIKNIVTYDLERVVILELEPFGDSYNVNKKLIIELMGKHSNIILTDNNDIIIDSLRHTQTSNNSYRNIFAHQKYIFPKTEKLSFLNVKNFNEFYATIMPYIKTSTPEKVISNTYTGISKTFVKSIIVKNNITVFDKEYLENIYNNIKEVISNINTCNLHFKLTQDKKDYYLTTPKTSDMPFCLNFFVDDFYYEKENNDNFVSYRNSILRLILEVLKKYKKRLSNINIKLEECDNMDTYKLYGELITANLYKLNNKHLDKVELENYYDNNTLITIPLDSKDTVNTNAKKYFKKYNKLKNALTIVEAQKKETMLELNYIESIIYELENCKTIDDVNVIFEEISENGIFKDKFKKYTNSKAKKTKNKVKNFNPLEFTINGFKVYVGRNNKENDWLTTKFAKNSDIWFHTKDIHGSHVILKTENATTIDEDTLVECAKLAAEHSKAKLSSNVPVDYCQVKYVKKPSGSKPGMVIYTNNKTIYVNM